MKLKSAARLADWDIALDGYSELPLFKAQFSSYDGAQPDGSYSRRRTVSLAPEIEPADRRVVIVENTRWIMGELVTDTFKGKPIRTTASAKQATDLYLLLTPAQAALQDVSGRSAYGFMSHLKDTVNSLTDSSYDPQYEVTFAITEEILAGHFLRSPRSLLHVRSVHLEAEGYWVATADELDRAPDVAAAEVTATFSGKLDPITEEYLPGTTTTGILMELYKLYTFNTQADPRNQAGDMSLLVAKSSITPSPGQEVIIAGQAWRNIKFTEYRDAWNIQIRRM